MSSSKIVCGPCAYGHINKDAEKWCTNCEEGFCKDCVQMHKATKITRGHNLIGVDDFQKLAAISIKQTCEEHGKTLGFYCKSHDSVLCLACVTSKHTLCGDIIPLEDAAANAKTSTALTDLEETISIGLNNVKSIIENTNTSHLENQEKNIKDEIREFRIKINNRLDVIEQDLILKLESKLAKYRSKYKTVIQHMKESKKTMTRLKEQVTEMKNLASDLQIFLGTRQINRTVHECLKSTSGNNVIDKYNVNVEMNPVLNSLLTEVQLFGNINTEVTKTNIPLLQPKIDQAQVHVHPTITSVTEVGIRKKKRLSIKKTSESMLITGCAILPNGQLLIADCHGKEQLMQYNQDGTHIRDIPVSSKPYDVTVIDLERVAVSYSGSKYIEMLNIKNIKVEKKVNLGNNIWGLSYHGEKLYVVVYNSSMHVIDLSGKTVNKINIPFVVLSYVAAAADRIYYSDYTAVTCCDMSGKQIWKFKDDSVVNPLGLTVDNNQNVFVVGYNSNNVTIISRDGKTSKTLLTTSDGLSYPRAIYFSKDTGDLLVCNESDTKYALFKITG